jgi:hypothetical protein
MAHRLAQALAFLILLAALGQARAQDDAVQRIYAAVEKRIQAEYEFNVAGVTRGMSGSGASLSRIAPIKDRMKVLSYNKAALFAFCAAEAERNRPPNAGRVPMDKNLMLTTCVEIKIGQLQKFSELAAYADFFFPERIASCGERSRLREQEKTLAPYPFLQLDEPKLYDFLPYNECLMTEPKH